jgi:pSer/pThr/pTyr-binding forkhead associated (FHA) protein
MKARLFCKTGILSGKAIEIREAATIGKSADSDLELDAQFISNKHARIYFDKNENCYFLEDLRSRNGTQLDGLKVTQKEKLGKLHVITFAKNFDFIFQVIEDEAPKSGNRSKAAGRRDDDFVRPPDRAAAPGRNEAPAIGRTVVDETFPRLPDLERSTAKGQPAKEARRTIAGGEFDEMPFIPETGASKGRAALSDQKLGRTIVDEAAIPIPDLQSKMNASTLVGGDAGNRAQAPPTVFFLEFKINGRDKQSVQLSDGENVVGRSSDCAIFIDDPSMSRRHAILIVKSGRVTVRDLGSRNHTFIDKKAIASEVEVRPESKLQFGAVEARLIRNA